MSRPRRKLGVVTEYSLYELHFSIVERVCLAGLNCLATHWVKVLHRGSKPVLDGCNVLRLNVDPRIR